MRASPYSGWEIVWGLAPTRHLSSNTTQNVCSTPFGWAGSSLRRTQVPVHSTLFNTFSATGTNLSKFSSPYWMTTGTPFTSSNTM
jgi:hypothetical protein